MMVGCEKERGWGGLSRETLNELNLVSQAGQFYQMQSDMQCHFGQVPGYSAELL